MTKAAVSILRSRLTNFLCPSKVDAGRACGLFYCLPAGRSYAGRDCVAHANIWLRKDQRELDVDYCFEAGDADASELKRVMEKDKQPPPKFAPGRNTAAGVVGLTPLLAADFAAYVPTMQKRWQSRLDHYIN
jgi:hypothetical protein